MTAEVEEAKSKATAEAVEGEELAKKIALLAEETARLQRENQETEGRIEINKKALGDLDYELQAEKSKADELETELCEVEAQQVQPPELEVVERKARADQSLRSTEQEYERMQTETARLEAKGHTIVNAHNVSPSLTCSGSWNAAKSPAPFSTNLE